MKHIALFLATAAALAALLISRIRIRAADGGTDDELPAGVVEILAPITESIQDAVARAPAMFSEASTQLAAAARRIFALPQTAQQYADAIRTAEQANGIPESLLGRVLYQESRFRPDIISGQTRSPVGAVGIAQFMPATAAEWGVNATDPYSSIDGAGRYLRWLYERLGSWEKALAGYNWGIGNVQRQGLEKAPAETRAYVSEILSDVDVA